MPQRRRHAAPRPPSSRMLRVGEELRHILTQLLRDGVLRDPSLQDVSVIVSEVRVASDLGHATVFVTPFGGGDPAVLADRLNKAAGYLRGLVGQEIDLRHTPALHFVADNSYDQAAHIEALLRDPAVARDLKHDDDSEAE